MCHVEYCLWNIAIYCTVARDKKNCNSYPRQRRQITRLLHVCPCNEHLLPIKKRSERRKHCALALVRPSQKNSPRRRPPSRGAGRSKFNQLVTTFNYKPTGEDRYTQFRIIVVTDPPTHTPTHPQTDRTDYNTLRRS